MVDSAPIDRPEQLTIYRPDSGGSSCTDRCLMPDLAAVLRGRLVYLQLLPPVS